MGPTASRGRVTGLSCASRQVLSGTAMRTPGGGGMATNATPDRIMQIGMGFWASKALLSAVELELFTALGTGAKTGAEIGDRLGLHPRSQFDFLDSLVSLGLLE